MMFKVENIHFLEAQKSHKFDKTAVLQDK